MEQQTAYSIKQLLSENRYIIPIYQRNYAWQKKEISQLIRDIQEYFTLESNKTYYIGSLVCFKRENGDFELIDGQQRHTTLSLINAVLKHWDFGIKGDNKLEPAVSSSNLAFDSRKNVQQFLKELYTSNNYASFLEETTITGVQNFKDALHIIAEEFGNANLDLEKFCHNFYNNVKFFRVEVPPDTDLNHYFEIMNNRGEQLEKHEIVKSLLMSKLVGDGLNNAQATFSRIWDACSDMSKYIYYSCEGLGYADKNGVVKSALFDETGNLAIEDFNEIIPEKTEENKQELALSEILNSQKKASYTPDNKDTGKEKYRSIIDFQNFLLQVLKLSDDAVGLDDKNLVNIFRAKLSSSQGLDPKKFIMDLLKYRSLFDKYIIKQDLSDSDETKQNWGIRTLHANKTELNKTYQNDKSESSDDDELIKLQTMLYYANPANTNNTWLQQILKCGFYNENPSLFAEKIYTEIADKRFDAENLSYPSITVYNLYFIDFLLWKLYKEKVQGRDRNLDQDETLEAKIAKNRDLFNSFKFRSVNSKEHLFPQSKAKDFGIPPECLNGIGNLCLISNSQNSSGNKDLPAAKKKSFSNDNTSLKRLIMFESYNKEDNWGMAEIAKHAQEIEDLLKNAKNLLNSVEK